MDRCCVWVGGTALELVGAWPTAGRLLLRSTASVSWGCASLWVGLWELVRRRKRNAGFGTGSMEGAANLGAVGVARRSRGVGGMRQGKIRSLRRSTPTGALTERSVQLRNGSTALLTPHTPMDDLRFRKVQTLAPSALPRDSMGREQGPSWRELHVVERRNKENGQRLVVRFVRVRVAMSRVGGWPTGADRTRNGNPEQSWYIARWRPLWARVGRRQRAKEQRESVDLRPPASTLPHSLQTHLRPSAKC